MSEAKSISPTRIVQQTSGWSFPDLREVWEHRELVYVLARRDIAVRYKQTAIGAFWAVLQPVALAGVFSLFLGLLAKVPAPNGIPYPAFALTGMTMWLFFSVSVANGAESTLSSSDLITKVYFPRLVLPIAAVIPAAVDFVIALPVLILVALLYGIPPSLHLLLVPVVFGLAFAVALGVSLWLSAVVVRYRDARLLVPFFTQVMLFVTPVIYALSLVPDRFQSLYAINPLVGVLEGFRWCILREADFPGLLLLIPLAASVLLLIGGLYYFHRAERVFADVI